MPSDSPDPSDRAGASAGTARHAHASHLDLPAASAGVRSQWIRRHRTWPSLLEALAPAPRVLSGVMAMRAVALGPGRAYFGRFEDRLCEVWGIAAPTWPAGFGEFTSRPGRALGERPQPNLPRLAPEQALLATGPLTTLPLPCARVLSRGLETCFGKDAGYPVRDDALCRSLQAVVPPTWRASWERGAGLDPPQVFLPPAQLEVSRLVETLASDAPGLMGPPPSTTAMSAADRVIVTVAVAVLQLAATDPSTLAGEDPLKTSRAA